MRLSKILSLSSVASRSKAQELIRDGKVKVNNQIIDKNVMVDIDAQIEVKGVRIAVDLKTKLWGFYKPKHVFCNTNEHYEYEEQQIIQQNCNAGNKKILKQSLIENENQNKTLTMVHEKRIRRFLDVSAKEEELRRRNCEDHYDNVEEKENGIIYTSCEYVKKRNESDMMDITDNFSNELVPKYKECNISKEPSNKEIKYSMIPSSSRYKLNMNIFDFIRKKNILYERSNKVENCIPRHLIVINSLNSQSEGMVLFTNDGDFANNLKNVKSNILSEYLVKAHGELNNEKLQLLRTGCYIGNTHVKPLKVEIIKSYLLNNWIKITYVEHSSSDLFFLFEKCNLLIRKCKRISFGPYRSSQLSTDFFMPLKIHSTLNHLIPKIRKQRVLTHPYGNITTDENQKVILVKDYIKNSLLHRKQNID